MKKYLTMIAFDAVLLGFNLWWVADSVRNEQWLWMAFWLALSACWVWCLDRDVRRYKAEKAERAVLAPVLGEQRIDLHKASVEPVETPDPDWLEKHAKECVICRKFQEGE